MFVNICRHIRIREYTRHICINDLISSFEKIACLQKVMHSIMNYRNAKKFEMLLQLVYGVCKSNSTMAGKLRLINKRKFLFE